MARAPLASCLSGRAILRAHHQMNSSVAAASGSEFSSTLSIKASMAASVTCSGRSATMPQPVAGTMA
ncbi:hypothetical protein D3C71_1945500 [compost metagenome]